MDLGTSKYIIYAELMADGYVEKHDVIGAIFGQTEGLLSNELDLRDLQKSGRIGRIDVELENMGGKSLAKITLPSSLDKVETSILAATLETIDRVGPCLATVNITNVEDIRISKRHYITERAQNILKKLMDEMADSYEITDEIKESLRVQEILEFGEENLPCGPNVIHSDAIIVVEGRADVLNLLRCGIKNAVAVEGTSVPKSIIELTKRKTTTVFTDGDRGGELILKELLQTCDVDYVARAPYGKEVEETSKKEILKCLRSKIPIEQYNINTEELKNDKYEKYNKYEKPHGNGNGNGNGHIQGAKKLEEVAVQSSQQSKDKPEGFGYHKYKKELNSNLEHIKENFSTSQILNEKTEKFEKSASSENYLKSDGIIDVDKLNEESKTLKTGSKEKNKDKDTTLGVEKYKKSPAEVSIKTSNLEAVEKEKEKVFKKSDDLSKKETEKIEKIENKNSKIKSKNDVKKVSKDTSGESELNIGELISKDSKNKELVEKLIPAKELSAENELQSVIDINNIISVKSIVDKIQGTGMVSLIHEGVEKLINIDELMDNPEIKDNDVIILDYPINQQIVDKLYDKTKLIIGKNVNVSKRPSELRLLSFNELKA
ncbi:DNA primase DnaG [Methanococcus voltae]|uniref:DNA primase DnaG n=1 Tax=Methanococcus voltae (strain ATCC BAA-1334 / A3) TaxID=456320 RepID=D7DRD4_METV3|nr:DNA primase DnaG [Methanococcus voltae]MCS3901071.1 DNA primase [Methanococcus voltae]